MQRWLVPHRLVEVLLQLAVVGVVYGAELSWAFMTKRAWNVGDLAEHEEDEVNRALVNSYQEEG